MITVTETAAKKALALMEKAQKEESADASKVQGLRMQVVGGGCSGFQYNLGFDEQRSNDKVFEYYGLKVFVDPRSTLYLAGSTLDYKDGLMESGFKITNPNAKSTCGCGESFSV
jgi:iron-sulfur cluster assembly protein